MNIVICVYGNFKEKDVRIQVFTDNGTHKFAFQNILIEAGYDAYLFNAEVPSEEKNE